MRCVAGTRDTGMEFAGVFRRNMKLAGDRTMRMVAPISRQKLSAKGSVLLVDRDLGNPYAIGEIVSDVTTRFEIIAVEGTPDPRHVSLIVHVVPA